MQINVVNFNKRLFEKQSRKKVSEMSSLLSKLLAVWSCPEILVL